MGEETNAGRLKERDRIAQPKRILGNNIKMVLKNGNRRDGLYFSGS